MNKSIVRVMAVVAVAGLAAWLSGCQCGQAKPAPAPKAKVVAGCPAVRIEGDQATVSRSFPTGNASSSVVYLESTAPVEVAVGEAFMYTIKATNLTDCPLDDVVVWDKLPEQFELKGSDPKANLLPGNVAEWQLGAMGPNETKTITAQLASKAAGQMTHCAKVKWDTSMCRSITVVAPKLQLAKTLPASVLVCDDIPVKLVVSNTGTGSIRGVTVTDTLPAGLTTPDGKSSVTFDAGVLAAGQAKEFAFVAKAAKPGQYTNAAQAKSEGGMTADATAAVVVKQPVLTIAKTATETQFAGRNIDYAITVTNTGDTDAANVVLTDAVPAGTTFVSATDGGQLVGSTVTWNMAKLAPNGSAKVGMTVRADAMGKITNSATATAVCAAPVTATAATEVKGVPAILLEVVDVADPIEVGGQETYTITVTNQGTIPDTGIKIVATLEDSQAFVSCGGATAGKAEGQVVTFEPLASLAAKARAEWKVTVKALKAGDVRFKVVMTSEFLKRTVEETEATQQY